VKVTDWRLHDLRRYMRSGLGSAQGFANRSGNSVSGISPQRPGSLASTIQHSYADEKRDAWQKWGDYLAHLTGVRDAKMRWQRNQSCAIRDRCSGAANAGGDASRAVARLEERSKAGAADLYRIVTPFDVETRANDRLWTFVGYLENAIFAVFDESGLNVSPENAERRTRQIEQSSSPATTNVLQKVILTHEGANSLLGAQVWIPPAPARPDHATNLSSRSCLCRAEKFPRRITERHREILSR
jgi:hypothetical protein